MQRYFHACTVVFLFCMSPWTIGCVSSAPMVDETILDGRFDLDNSGFVKNWLIVEPQTKPHYEGRTQSGDMAVGQTKWVAELPDNIALDAPGPFGTPWIYYHAGRNIYMEHHVSATHPSAGRMYAAVDLEASNDCNVPAYIRIGGWAECWLNGTHLEKSETKKGKINLSLRKGRNQFVAYLQNGGLRGIHFRIGLQLPDQRGRIRVLLPGPEAATAEFEKCEHWIRTLELKAPDRIIAKSPPPYPVLVDSRDEEFEWPKKQSQFKLPKADLFHFNVCLKVKDQEFRRIFEIPQNFGFDQPDPKTPLAEHRRKHLESLVNTEHKWRNYLATACARKALGMPPVYDPEKLERELRRIDNRIDCADFDMAFALRLIRLGAGTKEDHQRIKKSALGFRYWRDDPGNDGMCFHSENHRLLFHGAELISGNLWPDEVFTNTGLTGREQTKRARKLIIKWLDEVESQGFHEFLSTTYVPITVGAVMNLVDFSDDPEISQRATKVMDRIYEMLALNTFDGIMCGPQGRAYRWILYPQRLGTQALISYATPLAVANTSGWSMFVATSPKYRPPDNIEELMTTPVRIRYSENIYLIDLVKTRDYMLSSIQIPGSGVDPEFEEGLWPGWRGYQQHIWHATLARDCHVFTNHPGAGYDWSHHRPGYWAGTNVMPRQTQRDNMLLQIFKLPENESINFTHAYWPSDVFDRQEIRGNWIFGKKRTGYIALWCSTKPEWHNEVLTNRELRAYGRKMAWVCVCGGESDYDSLEAFIDYCENLNPKFSPFWNSLYVKGQKPLSWYTREQ